MSEEECPPLHYGDRQGPVPMSSCRYEKCDLYISGSGNDTTGTGTAAYPFATLGHALSVAGNGQTIGVLSGTYRESNLSTSLTGLAVKAASCYVPIFTVAAEYTAWIKTSGRTSVYETAYTSALCYRAWNGATLLTSVISVAACDALSNSFYFDNPNNLLYVNIGGAMPTAINVAATVNPILTASGAGFTWQGMIAQWSLCGLSISGSNSLISNSTFRYFAGSTSRKTIVYVAAGNNSLIENCAISGLNHSTGSRGVHIESNGTGVMVRNCTIDNCYIGAYISWGSGHVVDGCTIHDCYDGVFAETTTNPIIRHCVVHDFNSTGIQTKSSMVAHHNVVHTAAAVAGLYNYAYMANDTSGGLVQWYHNVAANLMMAPGLGIGFRTEGGSVVTAYNNISYNNKIGMSDSGGLSITNGDYNCVNGNTSQYDWPGNTWPAGANDIVVDPLFTAPATNDFTLQGASPCLNAGTFVAGVSELGPPTDIGRFET